jgi:hypothetical protein
MWCELLGDVFFERSGSLRKIGERAFSHTAIESIDIPASVEVIGGKCFFRSNLLSRLTFERGSKLRQIGKMAFDQTGLQEICIPSRYEIVTGWPLVGLSSVTLESRDIYHLQSQFLLSGDVLIRYFGHGGDPIGIGKHVGIIGQTQSLEKLLICLAPPSFV